MSTWVLPALPSLRDRLLSVLYDSRTGAQDDENVAALLRIVDSERTDAAHREWERWKRVNGVAAAGLRTSAEEIEHVANHVDIDMAKQRDLVRCAAVVRACALEMDGENWLKSPLAMAEKRKLAGGANT